MPYFTSDGIVIEPFDDSPLKKKHAAGWWQEQKDKWLKENTGRRFAAVVVRFRNGHSRLFKWDASAKAFNVEMADLYGWQVHSGDRMRKGAGFSGPLPQENFDGEA